VRRLAATGMGGTEVARQLGIARASVYRLLQN
jgi:DNA-binding IclR family transcriptional regulator